MGKIIWICALMVAVFVVFTDFIDRDGNCLTWSELWDTTSIYREPLYVLLMLPRIVNNIAVCQLGNIFQLKTSHLIAITAPVTGALFGGLIGVILSKSKPATRWIVVCGILGSFLGMYNGILGMVGECRISEPITEYYKSVVQGLFWTLPVGFLFLPIAISYPIFCKYH